MTPDRIQATARALVAALFPALAVAMYAAIHPRVAFAQAGAVALPGWRQAYGPDVAAAAFDMLQRLSPAVVICPDVQDEWLASAPVEAIAAAPPPAAIPDPPPVVGIGSRLYRAAARFWRPPAS